MSVTDLQQRIRQKKTPLALGLRPELEKLSPKILKNFTDMFGPGSMAEAEALRYHGTTLLDAAAETLPAVMLHGASYLRCGMMGADVLSNLISAAHAKGLYVILGIGAEEPALWQGYGADAITVDPYMGSDCCDAGEQAVFAWCAPATRAVVRCSVSWPVTGRCTWRWQIRWPATVRRWWWAPATGWTSAMSGGSAPSPSCCCRSATARMPSPPSTSTATAPCWWTSICNTRRNRRRPCLPPRSC